MLSGDQSTGTGQSQNAGVGLDDAGEVGGEGAQSPEGLGYPGSAEQFGVGGFRGRCVNVERVV